MFDVAPTELLVIAIIALVVIGPKDLPRVMGVVGRWVGRARGVARHFREGLDEIVRQSELEEMEKKWRAENERIMREHPPTPAIEGQVVDGQVIEGETGEPAPQPMLPAATDYPPHPATATPEDGAHVPEPIPGEVLPTPHIPHPAPTAAPEPLKAEEPPAPSSESKP
ncbi:Sec-independent protein translocase protein TatB [Sphingomonas naphthae]|uniref:Sec-independent protein translocase protein TatB n=1 Tax=Sphingomonas naphthae TaxID=1813468 RepID=A0ABY7TJH9_9SPHN|nr:Sec-independent protein translocase protein TatB [Sphingomonas naphthae]WCT73382.1 Sec-independent protein translocase protein TatB [Sphingomonas naphthae]